MAEYKDKRFLSIECSSLACSHILQLGTSAIDFRRNSAQVQTAWLIPAISLFKNMQKSYFCAPVVSQLRRISTKKIHLLMENYDLNYFTNSGTTILNGHFHVLRI